MPRAQRLPAPGCRHVPCSQPGRDMTHCVCGCQALMPADGGSSALGLFRLAGVVRLPEHSWRHGLRSRASRWILCP